MLDKLICNVLNKVLGTYIENLDGSNLKLSLWSGNADLYNLDIKQSALNDLNLPIRPVYGHLDHLQLVIPWNQLFSGVWEAHITGVLLLVTPNATAAYDREKESALKQQLKLEALDRIAENRAKALLAKSKDSSTATSKTADDTYVEKLIAQIVRNIQITIKNVHIRYEDSLSNVGHPYSCGITMSGLSVVSTNKDYTPCLDTDRLVYKLMSLEGLGFYWHPEARLISQESLSKDELRKVLLSMVSNVNPPEPTTSDGISNPTMVYPSSPDLEYILSPLSLSARLQLNPHPDKDAPNPFTIPKLSLSVKLHHLGLSLSRRQYCGVMGLLESVDRMRVSSQYRHHRPVNVNTYSGNARLWWVYAYNCHLDNICRIRRNWSWLHIKAHRDLCRKYKQAYKAWLASGQKKDKSPVVKECELELDVFNINLVRQQAQVEFDRENRNKQVKQSQQQSGGGGGWVSGWLGWGKKSANEQESGEYHTDDETSTAEGVADLANKLSLAEKTELYEAIGYSENSIPPTLPVHYQDLKLTFLLSALTLHITDDASSDKTSAYNTPVGSPSKVSSSFFTPPSTASVTVVLAHLAKLRLETVLRTAADAVKVECSLGSFVIDGMRGAAGGTGLCRIVDSLEVNSSTELVEFLFETNPLSIASNMPSNDSSKCDEVLIMNARPLQLVFHAQTIMKLVNILSPPQTLSLQQLQAAALNQLEVMKARSVSGLQAAMEASTRRHIRITVHPSRIVLPEDGQLSDSCCVLVLSLGALNITSKWPDSPTVDKRPGSPPLDSYDSYVLNLTDVQMIVCGQNESWQEALLVSNPGDQFKQSAMFCDSSVQRDGCLKRPSSLPLERINEASSTSSSTKLALTKYLLPPTHLQVELKIRITSLDPTQPKAKVEATLPLLNLTLSDDRLSQLAHIVLSMNNACNDLNSDEVQLQTEQPFTKDLDVNMNMVADEILAAAVVLPNLENSQNVVDTKEGVNRDELEAHSAENLDGSPQYNQLFLSFRVPELSILLVTTENESVVPQLSLTAQQLGGELVQRTYDTKLSLYLQHLTILKLGEYEVELVSTRFKSASSEFTLSSCVDTPDSLFLQEMSLFEKTPDNMLFHATYKIISNNSPDLHTVYKSTTQFVTIHMATLSLHLEHHAISSLMNVMNSLQHKLEVLNAVEGNGTNIHHQRPGEINVEAAHQGGKNSHEQTGDQCPGTEASTPSMETPAEEFPPSISFRKNISSRDLITGQKISSKGNAEVILLRLKAHMEQVSVSLSSGDTHIAYAHITGLSVNMIQDNAKLSINSRLRDIGVTDPNPCSLHRQVVSVEDKAAWDFAVEIYSNNTGNNRDGAVDLTAVDMKLSLTMGKTRLVYLNTFLANIIAWASAINTTESTVTQARQAAAEAAKANIAEMVHSQPKISLQCTIKAPLVYVPEAADSTRGLLFNLGQLKITNKFEVSTDCRNQLGQPALSDVINMTLTDVKVSVVDNISRDNSRGSSISHFSGPTGVAEESASAIQVQQKEVPLLLPITFNLNITRNLSSDWQLTKPLVAVTATLLPMHMKIREEDIRLVMKLLHHNLGAAGSAAPSTATQPGVGAAGKLAVLEADTGEVIVKRATVSLIFTIEAITLQLHSDAPTHQFGGASIPLSELTLHRSVMMIDLQNDSSVTALLNVQDCTMADTRPFESMSEKRRISRLLQRKEVSAGAPAMLMLSVKYSNEGEISVDMKVSSFLLVLNLPYIFKLQSFFLDNFSSEDSAGADDQMGHPSLQREVSARASGRSTSMGDGITSGTNAEDKLNMPGLLRVSVILEQPDIAVVKDITDIDTPAIFIHGAITSDVRLCDDRRNISCSLQHLQLYTCVYNEEKRSKTMNQIMSSCSVEILDSATASHADSVRVEIGQVELSCTPDTIELVMSVLQSLSSLEDKSSPPTTTLNAQPEDLSKVDHTGVWLPKPFDLNVLPGIPVDEATEVLADSPGPDNGLSVVSVACTTPPTGSKSPTSPGSETAVIDCALVTITLETGKGSTSVPLVKFQSRANCTVNGFLSHKLIANAEVSLEAAYFNPFLGAWEPLLEPIAKLTGEGLQHFPVRVGVHGELQLMGGTNGTARRGSDFSCASVISPSPSYCSIEKDIAQDYERVDAIKPPLMTFSLDVKDPLEFTISRSFLKVWESLSDTYLAAYNRGELDDTSSPSPPYFFTNNTGYTTVLHLQHSHLQLHPPLEPGNPSNRQAMLQGVEVCVQSGASVSLYDVTKKKVSHKRRVSLVNQDEVRDTFLHVRVPELASSQIVVPLNKACKRYFPVNGIGDQKKQSGGIVSSVTPQNATRNIVLSSCVTVVNTLKEIVELYFMTERGNEVELVERLLPGSTCSLPLRAVHTQTAELFFCVSGYSVSSTPLVWRGLQNDPNKLHLLSCVPRNTGDHVRHTNAHVYNFSASCDIEQILWGSTNRHTLDSVLVRVELRPKLQLQNLLPFAIVVNPPNTSERLKVEPSELVELPHAELGAMYIEVELLAYFGRNWRCGRSIEREPAELDVWTFYGSPDTGTYTPSSDGCPTLELGVHTTRLKGTVTMGLYCPFWMVNKTGLDLTYKNEVAANFISHSRTNTDPVLFSFRSKAFFGKKKASVRAEDSAWSDKFALDVVGSNGIVTCKSKHLSTGIERLYQLNVSISLSANALTKIVVLTPFHKVANRTPLNLFLKLHDHQSWFRLKAGECVGLWPDSPQRTLQARFEGTNDATQPIAYDFLHDTLFRLDNKYGGVYAEVLEDESGGGILLSLSSYRENTAAALIINQLHDLPVTIWQENFPDEKYIICPGQMMQYGWSLACQQPVLCVQCGEEDPFNKVLEVGVTQFPSIGGMADLFSNGQRCLVFSNDIALLEALVKDEWQEQVDMELNMSVSSFGLSLVDNIKGREVMYAGITSSGVVWESRKYGGRKRRPFSVAQTEQLETAYKRYQFNLQDNPESLSLVENVKISEVLEVNFHNMTVKKPFNRHLHRTYEPGMWLQLQSVNKRRNLHFKVNKLQVDNQLVDILFPVVFSRVNPAKSVMAETVPKPLFELSVVQVQQPNGLIEYKYVSALLQEFHVMVELPFISAVLNVLYPSECSNQQQLLYNKEKFLQDDKLISSCLTEAVSQKLEVQPMFFHFLHLSPIKMHLSFSLTGLDSESNAGGGVAAFGGQVLHLFLQSVGVTLTEMQDIEFKLGYFERREQWNSWETLQATAVRHYCNQVLSQLYVVVLGLDLLGNPFSFVMGVTKGMGALFYEPIQGAVEGPGEFAEGLVLGARSFVGKTVGGLAGVASRITSTIGKGVASLTLDEDYQRRRREAQLHKPSDGLETMARGVKGLGTGVFDGVTGVVTKPFVGARDEGVEGFFKGVGKGMVGLVTRPASGVIDFASGSFGAVKRATEGSENITRQRPSRHIAANHVITPYCRHSAQGHTLLMTLEKGQYSKTDTYVCHIQTNDPKAQLMATDIRLLFVSKNDLMGVWSIEWQYKYQELTDPPLPTPKGLRLNVKQDRKKVLGIFGGGSNSKEVLADRKSPQVQWFLSTVKDAYLQATRTTE